MEIVSNVLLGVLFILLGVLFMCFFYLLRCLVSGTINKKYFAIAVSLIPENKEIGFCEWDIGKFIFLDLHLWTINQVIKSQKKRLGLCDS